MEISQSDWEKGIYQNCEDPTEWNGKIPTCKTDDCERDIDTDSEFCNEHQDCVMCGENDDCDCEDEWDNVSACCEAKMDTDQKMCYSCKDHCSSAWEEAIESANYKKRESRYPKDEAKLSKK